MRSAWIILPFMALGGCDSVVATNGTDGEASTGASTSGPSTSLTAGSTNTAGLSDTAPPPTTTGIDTSGGTDGPLTAGTESATGEDSSSSSGSTGLTSSTGGESSSSSTSTTDPTGVGFIDPSDSGGDDDCDTYLQDCVEGEKCNPWANDGGSNWNALDCFPVDPNPVPPGDPCEAVGGGVSGVDNCEVGSMCWDVDEDTDIGVCISMCEGSAAMPTCADPSTSCVISNGGVLNLCLPSCDPLMQDCVDGQGCYPIDDTFVCAPDASDENGQAGEPCEFINGCDPGTACVQPDVVGPDCPAGVGACCSEFCNLTAPVCSLAEQECVAWFEEGAAPPQYEDLGICSVPA